MRLRLVRESAEFAYRALRANLLRTVLSLLGVTVGIFCIVGVSSFFDSIEGSLEDSFSMIGDDLLFVQKWPMGPEQGDQEYAWWKYMSRRNPRVQDADLLQQRLQTAEAVAFQVKTWKTVEFRNNNLENVMVNGVSYPFNQAIGVDLEDGRWFTQNECISGAPLAIIGVNVAEGLFGNESPIGRKIKVGGLKTEVIGLIKREGNGLLPESLDDVVMININMARRLVDVRNAQEVGITVKAREGIDVRETKDELIGTLRAIRGVKPRQDNDFSVMEASAILDAISSIFGVVDVVALILGSFALLVGGFGVLNIMFVSVRERTPLIGIQKALGARNAFIRNQFLMESVFLCMIGALVALVLLWILMMIGAAATGLDLSLSPGNVLYGVVIATVLGLLAGYLPARRASRMNPVDAMRFK